MRIACLVIGLFAAVSVAAPAHAQDAAAAETFFREGRALMQEEAYEEACEKFALSQRLDPSPGTLMNLALCNERLGKLATAWARYTEAANLAAARRQPDRARVAKEHADELEPRLSRMAIRFEGPRPPGLSVTRGEQDVTDYLGVAVPVDPGSYAIEARAPGYAAWRETAEISEEGATVEVRIPALVDEDVEDPALEDADAAREDPEPAPDPVIDDADVEGARDGADVPDELVDRWGKDAPEDTARGSRKSGVRTAGIAMTTSGAALFAGGLGFGLHARSQWSSAQELCNADNECSARGVELADSADRSANVANVLVGAGLVATATGLILWANAPSASGANAERRAGSARLMPVATRTHVGVALDGRF